MIPKIINENKCPTFITDENGENTEDRMCTDASHYVVKYGFCAHVLPTENEGEYAWFRELTE